MNNKVIIGIVIAAILIVGGYLAYNTGPIVSAQGSTNLKVQPDLVSVNINVETRNQSAQQAQEQNKEISEKLLIELIKLGFDKDEFRFVNYNVYPDYEYSNGQQKSKGFVVYQQLVVKTSDVEKVPGIVDAAINAGALVSYINFELSEEKQDEYKKQALEEASQDAQEKANAIAEGQGKRLGRLVSIGNQEFNYPGPIAYYATAENSLGSAAAADARKAALNIAPQDLEVTASINAQYKLSLF